MLSAAITIVSLSVMLLIIAGLIFAVWRSCQHHKQKLAAQLQLSAHPLDQHITAILHVQKGVVVGIEKVESQFIPPASWYQRWRVLVSLGFVVMILLALIVQGSLVDGSLRSLTQGLEFSFLSKTTVFSGEATRVQPAAPAIPENPSMRLVRIDSAAREQYITDYQWRVWSYSSCSGIAMAMVMDAYGRHFIAADVLQTELNLGVWNVQLGLLREEGIALTAASYGFNTDWGHTHTLQDIIKISNGGSPVIVSVRDTTYYPNGHIFVIRGGDSQYVYIADSSPANFQRMAIPMFSGMWQGFSAILTPR